MGLRQSVIVIWNSAFWIRSFKVEKTPETVKVKRATRTEFKALRNTLNNITANRDRLPIRLNTSERPFSLILLSHCNN